MLSLLHVCSLITSGRKGSKLCLLPNLILLLSGKIALYQKVLESARSFDHKAIVIGCDCDDQCSGASMVESFIKLPRLSSLTTDQLVEICKNQSDYTYPSNP